MLSVNNSVTKPSFKQQGERKLFNPLAYSADQFITDLKKQEETRIKGDFLARNCSSQTAIYVGGGVAIIGELVCIAKILSKRISDFPTNELRAAFKNKMSFALASVITGGLAIGAAIQYWQNRIIDKKSPKPQEFLEKYGSDTSAKLSDNNLRSSMLGAQYNPVNGVIEINKNYIHDPIGQRLIKKYMKHELQHARQFEMIAALDDGLEKLNFVSVYNVAMGMKKNPIAFQQMIDIINDVNNDKSNKYDELKVPISGAEVDFKKYVKAIEIIMNNPQTKPKDIPMFIDTEHYKKAIAKLGPLSEKEKIKAEEYYKAALEYPVMTGLNLINPFSGYRSNILEKEARQAARSKTGKIDS